MGALRNESEGAVEAVEGEGRRERSALRGDSLHILEPVQRLDRLHPRQTLHDTLSDLIQRLGRVCVGGGLVDLLVYQGEGQRGREGGLMSAYSRETGEV